MAVIYKKYGKDEDGKSLFHKKAGTVGGGRSNTGGFYGNPEAARLAGAIGGRISKRGPAKKEPSNV